MNPAPGTVHPDVLALIPAAGFATRLGELPCSKEILPAGWSADRPAARDGKPLITFLLDRLAAAGIGRALVITRHEKSDIAHRLGDGERWGLELDYLCVAPTDSTAATLDAAYERALDSRVALGFPDIVFRPIDAYRRLLEAQGRGRADVALGLFPTEQPERSDMVELGSDGGIERLVIKQPDRGLRYTWSIAVWGPAFTEYLHTQLLEAPSQPQPKGRELYVGDVVQAALDDGLRVVAEVFEPGATVDLGTRRVLADPPAWVS